MRKKIVYPNHCILIIVKENKTIQPISKPAFRLKAKGITIDTKGWKQVPFDLNLSCY